MDAENVGGRGQEPRLILIASTEGDVIVRVFSGAFVPIGAHALANRIFRRIQPALQNNITNSIAAIIRLTASVISALHSSPEVQVDGAFTGAVRIDHHKPQRVRLERHCLPRHARLPSGIVSNLNRYHVGAGHLRHDPPLVGIFPTKAGAGR